MLQKRAWLDMAVGRTSPGRCKRCHVGTYCLKCFLAQRRKEEMTGWARGSGHQWKAELRKTRGDRRRPIKVSLEGGRAVGVFASDSFWAAVGLGMLAFQSPLASENYWVIGQLLGVGVANEAKEKCWLQHHLWKEVTIVRRALVANDGDKFKTNQKTAKWRVLMKSMLDRCCGGVLSQTHFFILAECGTPLSLHVT